jgi:hypothetical protein
MQTRTPDTKNFTVGRGIKSLKEVNDQIKVDYDYSNGLDDEPKMNADGIVTAFYVSPDYQNERLYYTLIQDGWRNAGYNAPYYWKVRRGKVVLTYTEGDISIYEDK